MVLLTCSCKATINSSAPAPYIPQRSTEEMFYASLEAKVIQILISCDGVDQSWGSGLVLDEHHVVTAYHVVDDACQVSGTKDMGKHRIPLMIKKSDPGHDISLLYGNLYPVTPTKLDLYPYRGEKVICMGYPTELKLDGNPFFIVSDGIVMGTNLPYKPSYNMHRVSAGLYYGNSGGPCFSSNGDLVGVVVQLQPVGFRIPLDSAYYLSPSYYVKDLLE